MPTSFADLSLDVLLLIIDQLTKEGSPTQPLKSFCLVCRGFRAAASSTLFKHAIIRVPRNEETDVSKKTLNRSLRFIAFLSENDHVRTNIQHIYIFRQMPEHVLSDLRPLNILLTKLMPLLWLMPRLSHVRISRIGSARFPLNSESEELRFLEAVQNLKTPVTISVFRHRGADRGYIHTWNPDLFDRVTCLKSVQIDIFNQPEFIYHPGPHYRNVEGTPSKDIARIICQNPRLRHLHLRLKPWQPLSPVHDLEAAEREHALENIGESVHALESLTLEGALHFSEFAWNAWDRNMNWAALRSLCVITESLVQEVTEHLINRLPSLESLRLNSNRNYKLRHTSRNNLRDSTRFQTDVKQFLSPLTLKDLSLSGCHPKNLAALEDNGAKLQRLLFHVQEGPVMWFFIIGPIRSTRNYKNIILSPNHLASLQRSCPELEWLGFDVLPFHLATKLDFSPPYTPLSGHSPAAHDQIVQGFRDISPARYRIAAKRILPLHNPHGGSPGQADPIFTCLTRLASLRHLRLFIHGFEWLPWSFNLTETMRLFLWLRRNKVGVALESLVVFRGPQVAPELNRASEGGPWIVHEMGPKRLYTIDRFGHVFWDVKGDYGSEVFEVIERSGLDGEYNPLELGPVWDQLEETDPTGCAVPNEWP